MQTAVITGASRRLGLYLTRTFLELGWRVIAITRQPSNDLKSLCDRQVDILETDYLDPDAIAETINYLVETYPTIDLLVHNASLFEKDKLHGQKLASFFDSLYCIHMKLPALLNEGLRNSLYREANPGSIVHITDIYAETPNEEFGLYCSTKAGSENLMKTYAKKYAPGIKVNSIMPGPIKFLPQHSGAEKDQVERETLLAVESGFLPILQGIEFLLNNAFVTGASIKIDGGRSIGKS